jgi:hypothetical protein
MAYRFSKVESPKYTVIKKYEDFELRQYESMVVAQTVMKKKSEVSSSEEGLEAVTGYIDGKNSENKKIAMTTPVIMEMGEKNKIALVMPKEHAIESLPKPNSNIVEIVNVLPKKYAVLTFPGYTDDKKIERYSDKLLKAVRKEGLHPVGNVHFMGYSDPWQVIGRKNEVAIEVR